MLKRETNYGALDRWHANGFNFQENVEPHESTIKGSHLVVPPVHIEFGESDALTTIGGFLVTDGSKARMIVSAKLTVQEKARGRMVLLRHLLCNRGVCVYLWSNADE